jgi:hypothetical protein
MSTMSIQRLSQGHLKVLTECPRKFEHIYLDLLAAPLAPEQHASMEWGKDFHRLMQQRELGLPIEPFLTADSKLEQAVTGLMAAAPHLFESNPGTTRDSEQVRTISIGNYLFTAIYDLVILDTTAQIIDWKTYGKPRNSQQLAQDWQTRLYLYIMAATSDYPPAAISFTYWFVLNQPQPECAEFIYSDDLHRQTHQDLQHLLARLDRWLSDRQQGLSLPQVPLASQLCASCHFASRCARLSPVSSLAIAEIDEIAI